MARDPLYLLLGTATLAWSDGRLAPLAGDGAADPSAAILAHAASVKASSVRLLYHPLHLAPQETACALGSRSVLRKILTAEFPALAAPDAVWSLLQPLPADGVYASLCFLDGTPFLPRLAAALAEQEIDLAGAWPLPAVCDALPEFSGRGALGVIALVAASDALVYSRLPGGARRLQYADAAAGVGPHVAAAMAAYAAAPEVMVCPLDETATPAFALPAGRSVKHLPPERLFAAAASLSPRGLPNFLPPATTIPWNALVSVAATVVLLIAAVLAARYAFDYRELKRDAVRRAAVADDLRAELEVLDRNRQRIEANTAFRHRLDNRNAAIDAALGALVRHTPEVITLASFSASQDGFVLTATMHGDDFSESGPLAAWVTALRQPDLPWTLAGPGEAGDRHLIPLKATFRP